MSSSNNSSSITYDDYILSDDEFEEKKDNYTSCSESDSDSDSVSDLETDINEKEEKTIDEKEEKKDNSNNFQFVKVNNDNTENLKKKKKDMEDCQICADKYNNSTRKEVKCLFCNYSSCKSCYEQYLLQSNDNICMNCKTIWNREFLDKNFTKVFLKGKYKKRREEVLIERQKALLQSTLPIAEIRLEAKKKYSVIKERRIEILNQLNILNREFKEIDNEMYRLKGKLNTRNVSESEKKQFVKKCPNSECRGFLSTRWKCGLCNTSVCSECHEIKEKTGDEEHVCKQENIETAKLISKECKNCPKCGTYIYKIDGCDQMYCMNCHTAFSWKTGLIESGRIHNPHYYEWMRKNGKQNRELMDIPCGGIPNPYSFKINVESYIRYPTNVQDNTVSYLMTKNYMNSLYSIIRIITHIQDLELRDFQEKIESTKENEFELRCKYLMNEISEDNWKTILQQNEYKLEYLNDISQLYQMISTVSSEIVLYIYNTSVNNTPIGVEYNLIIEKTDEILNLIDYFNNQSYLISKRFGKKNYDNIVNFSIQKTKV